MNLVEWGLTELIKLGLVFMVAYYKYSYPFVDTTLEYAAVSNAFLTAAALYVGAQLIARAFFTVGKHVNK